MSTSQNKATSSEDGWVLVTAILVMALILSIGLALLSVADTQQGQGRLERVRESSFNLAEGALYNQSQILARNWPSTSAGAFPSSCTDASTVTLCPNRSSFAQSTGGSSNSIFSSPDYQSGVAWTLTVRDNGNASGTPTTAYDQNVANGNQGTCVAPCTWDANDDLQLWVRAEGTVRGKTRRMVALLQLEQTTISFPTNAVTAGWASTSNNGNKAIVTTQDGATGSQVVLRCNTAPAIGGSCNQIQREDAQVSPDRVVIDGSAGNALSAAMKSALINGADHTYTTCPSPTDASAWSGIVYLNIPTGTTCNVHATVNSATSPGVLAVARGKIVIEAGSTFYGLIYHMNLDNSNGYVVDTSGNPNIYGGIAVDGNGGVDLGSASGNTATVNFRAGSFNPYKVIGTAGLVQNTWRELTPTQ